MIITIYVPCLEALVLFTKFWFTFEKYVENLIIRYPAAQIIFMSIMNTKLGASSADFLASRFGDGLAFPKLGSNKISFNRDITSLQNLTAKFNLENLNGHQNLISSDQIANFTFISSLRASVLDYILAEGEFFQG